MVHLALLNAECVRVACEHIPAPDRGELPFFFYNCAYGSLAHPCTSFFPNKTKHVSFRAPFGGLTVKLFALKVVVVLKTGFVNEIEGKKGEDSRN